MFGLNVIFVAWAAWTLGILIYWIRSYFPNHINWHFAISYFLAAFTVGFIGAECLIIEGIIALLKWIF